MHTRDAKQQASDQGEGQATFIMTVALAVFLNVAVALAVLLNVAPQRAGASNLAAAGVAVPTDAFLATTQSCCLCVTGMWGIGKCVDPASRNETGLTTRASPAIRSSIFMTFITFK